MKRKDEKWRKRLEGMFAWDGNTMNQWTRAKKRRQAQKKRHQNKG